MPGAHRTWKAWCAHMRDELVAPLNAVVELTTLLLKEARERELTTLAADLEKVLAASRRFLALLEEVLPASREVAEVGDFVKKVRHDLRTPLNQVLGYCDLWLENGEDLLMESLLADLREIRSLGQRMLERLNDLISFSQKASDPEIDLDAVEVPEMVRKLGSGERPRLVPAEVGTVLVVDDNELNCEILCRTLCHDGHKVETAHNGREALEKLQARSFDAVLLDIIMPGLNGFEVLDKLKADNHLQRIPVIVISAYTEMDDVVRCIALGAEDYLLKPPDPVLLRARLNACLEKKRLRDREAFYLEQIRQEQKRSDDLLHVILPGEIVKELKATNTVKPRRYENVAVLFCDIVGFTPYCDRNRPEDVVVNLSQLIQRWETITLRHHVEKIKTVGDAFMAVAGLLQPTPEHPVLHCVRCGLDMIESTRDLPGGWNARVGVHFGPVVAGVIGHRQYSFDLWGDTVNTAARMESHGCPGSITLSDEAWRHIAHCCRRVSLGPVEVKGKGRMEISRFAGFLGK
jgi:class 3 adenylate cyclase/CheY-like chemotaxis protein